jgi:hypothetical protein
MFDPLRGSLAKPAAVLTAVGAVKRAGVRSLAATDDADIVAARPLAVGGAI